MPKIKQWIDEIETLSPEEAIRKLAAIQEILDWPFFKEAFKGDGIESIETMLKVKVRTDLNNYI